MKNIRIEKFRKSFDELGIDCALVYKDANRNYLTGFTGDESYLLVMKEKSYFITDSRYTEQAESQVKGCDVLQYAGSIYDFIGKLVVDNNVNSVGIEEDYVTCRDYEAFKSKFGGAKVAALLGTIERQRDIKDDDEISLISKAEAIGDKAFEHILSFIKPGMRERDVAVELEYFMKKSGAQGLSFETIVASGKRSSLPHGAPTDKVIEKGDFVTMDYGCIYNEYCSDMTRTIVVGKANEKQKEIYNIVLEANQEVINKVKAGMSCFDGDKLARDVIKKHGYGEMFGHSTGHGVGREIHERPFMSPRTKNETLKSNMIVSDEPGIYVPDFGGVRIEDLLVIKDNGCEVLSKSPKNLIEL